MKEQIAKELVKIAKTLVAGYEADVLKGYLETALWSSTDDNDEPYDKNYEIRDFDRGSVSDAKKDVKKFLKKAGDLVYADNNDAFTVGHDLWLTRNGHGAGFWDGDYPVAGDELDEIAQRMGELYLYDDDGKVYFG